ncbi:MAG: tRNA pseudouridine(38-40) synthase TruA [Chloroflexota bacterium]|nr:tRNA pseudouridine(38-40) synthase TruA [Chloroflexota bacterium]
MPTSRRCARAVIEYDGTEFSGSQYQPNARTVQLELEDALGRLTGEQVRVRFAGRTDAGVHAAGQVAAFCLDQPRGRRPGWGDLAARLNHTLPPDLAVRSLSAADEEFDPRRDAIARVYRYRIRTGGRRRPIERRTTYEIDDRPDAAAMQAAADRLIGDHDFAAFGSDPNGRTRRSVKRLTVRRRGEVIEITVVADAFLRRMVRSIVAVLLHVGRGRLAPESVAALLTSQERALHGRAAPARGLTLERVVYAR